MIYGNLSNMAIVVWAKNLARLLLSVSAAMAVFWSIRRIRRRRRVLSKHGTSFALITAKQNAVGAAIFRLSHGLFISGASNVDIPQCIAT
jgi:hypothetical protein